MRKNNIIIICGVPGTGKSTTAIKLANILGIDQIISTDMIREVLRGLSTKKENPLLYSTTHESWKFFGEFSNKNLIKGITAHSRLIYPQIIKLINASLKQGTDIILEGVHLLPEILDFLSQNNANIYYFFLTIPEKENHFKMFHNKNKKRTIFHKTWYLNYEKISSINHWLENEVNKRNLLKIENKDLKKTIEIMLLRIHKNEILYSK